MCLAIPMQIEAIEGYVARCQAKGVYRDVSLFMLQDEMPAVGDYVMVHVGYAIQTMTEAEARSAWELFDEILCESDQPTEHA
ncbi:HypC/HybG/HupF family hydrogenase formation chaperone [Parasulfuritortus cantonensis]|uniref:HypC/HybG/HupF family hydrogenase formation chaperone n=2 Tax=Parasulfuritortus cantonensis TaxID=2528202 RepID=A0A4V2NV24_9PROT|nr:HypC/HybG/HupF family hydrogenase formation chaperone [Parasulfuritortus cantonensis]TCJ11846.1 HypC/HybG/HupF family hydrogenase formation chaperone [Parasulfuritortus cantonensis]